MVYDIFDIWTNFFHALEEHGGNISIGGRNITNLWFVNGIDALANEEQEIERQVESFDKTCSGYKMVISA